MTQEQGSGAAWVSRAGDTPGDFRDLYRRAAMAVNGTRLLDGTSANQGEGEQGTRATARYALRDAAQGWIADGARMGLAVRSDPAEATDLARS